MRKTCPRRLAVEAMALELLTGSKHREFGFPVAKDEMVSNPPGADFADRYSFFSVGLAAVPLLGICVPRRKGTPLRSSLQAIDVREWFISPRSASLR